ncbi:MAG TPA: ATP-binding protein, partial [Dyella sp.]|nr:ATP-binding protein [Dyella sp.]
STFIQRDTSYIRTLNMVEYAWRNRSDELAAKGADAFPAFVEHDDQAVVRPTSQSVPILVLGSGVDAWPQNKIDRYLGLANELSVIAGTSLTARGQDRGAMGYFYEPSEALFMFGDKLGSEDLRLAMDSSDRAALFSKLAAPNIDFNDIQALRRLREGNEVLGFFGKKLPKILSSVGKNPATGEPSVMGSFVAMDGETPIGAFVVYEPISRFVDELRKVTRNDMTIMTDSGEVAFDTGPSAGSGTVAAAFHNLPAAKLSGGGMVRYYQGGRFFIAERVVGSNWILVRVYRWSDILRGESAAMSIEIVMAIVLLVILWALLTRLDRSVFAPMLARARRVYQSDALNRTMIETSPVGLCVIQRSDAAPLLQNDLVRGYANRVTDSQVEFYQQLLQDYGNAEATSAKEPDVREFGFVIADADKENGRHLLVAAKPIVYRDRDALFCVLRDVTTRVEIEENLRRARQDSEQARLAAESASQAKTSFVATMSHEIRTPLNGILGHLELLGHSKLEPSQRERLDRIRFSADTLLAIISDVLDFSRIEAGQLDIDPIAFELRPLIEQTVLLYAPTAQRKGLKLYFNIDSGLATGYVADSHRIRQVLNNLVSNAVKFTQSGRIVLRAGQVSDAPDDKPWLRLEVIDSGIGMNKEQLRQVFQPFSQADASISRRFGGSGLGLTLCHQLAELMGGKIEARSTPGVGSVFTFDLPVAEDKNTSVTDPHPLDGRKIALLSAVPEWRAEISALLVSWGAHATVASQPSELDTDVAKRADALVIFGTERAWTHDEEADLFAHAERVIQATIDGPLIPEVRDGVVFISYYSGGALRSAILQHVAAIEKPHEPRVSITREIASSVHGGRVLLADDNAVNRELIQQQLETLGYTVDVAEDGEVAAQLWQQDKYAVVLTDINMPNMNGYELAQHLRAQGFKQPILAVTATALASEKIRCREAGITDLLLKPISLEKLDRALSHHVPRTVPARAVKASGVSKYPEKVRRVFVESGTRDLELVAGARQARDTESLLSRLHSMKGALLMMGEREVAEQCAALEKQIEAEGIADSGQYLDELESAMRELLGRYTESL